MVPQLSNKMRRNAHKMGLRALYHSGYVIHERSI